MIGLAIWIIALYPLKAADGILASLPLWACGILGLWISIRYPTRRIQVTPQGITLKGYVRTITMPWQSVLALTAREHFVGFVSMGVMYSLYSARRKLSFASKIPGSERLAGLVTEVTGLNWNLDPVNSPK
jgi:hypothetical protein